MKFDIYKYDYENFVSEYLQMKQIAQCNFNSWICIPTSPILFDEEYLNSIK